MKKYFLLLALALVFAGGCGTSNRSSSRPWDHPAADSHPGFDAPGEAGNEEDMQ